MKLTLTKRQLAAIKRPVFIVGLPGVGNVGKIAADLLVEQTKAKRLLRLPVEEKPGLVLVQQNNAVRFPELTLSHIRRKGKDFLILTGDSQPGSEGATYDLAAALVDLLAKLNCTAIITLGGIGLQEPPDTPRVYVTGNDKALTARFAALGANPKIHGVVGPIIGLTGVLLCVTEKRIPAAALLAESLAHPFYLGLRGAEQLLSLLSKAYGFPLDTAVIQESIAAMETHGQAPAGELPKRDETSYIG
jgi:proteasome assembly chaperone (PAC2) family protein